MDRWAADTVDSAQKLQNRPRDVMIRASGFVLLGGLAAAAFGRGAYFSTVQWLVAALIAVAFALAVRACPLSLRSCAAVSSCRACC
jgi:hypothetical protein